MANGHDLCSLMTLQAAFPSTLTPSVTQTVDIVLLALECVLVPGYWLWETGNNFPELTSSRNNIMGR